MSPATLLLLLTACSDYGIGRTKTDTEALGELKADPVLLKFGGVPIDGSDTRTFTVRSVGEEAVAIDSLTLEGSGCFEVTWEGDGRLLAPGESVDATVTYSPASLNDEGLAVITSGAADPRLSVDLWGMAITPAISLDPTSLDLVSDSGESVTADVVAGSVGSSTLQITDLVVLGDGFEVSSDLPVSLEPGETTTFHVTFTPSVEGDFEGQLWLSTNTSGGSAVVPLTGHLDPPCMGLAEAWARGDLAISMDDLSRVVLDNVGEEADICVDRWYVYISDESQDAGAGDPYFDPSSEYPYGSIELGPGDEVTLNYSDDTHPAWWCVEETQQTAPTTVYEFTGARLPSALLQLMLEADQDGVWSYMQDNPVVIVGRSAHYLELEDGQAAGVEVVVQNLGRQTAEATVTETIPAGFVASGFAPAPASTGTNGDGEAVYTFDVSLDAAVDTAVHEQTIYDAQRISYTLLRADDGCAGRVLGAEPTASWADSKGETRDSEGSPLVVVCL